MKRYQHATHPWPYVYVVDQKSRMTYTERNGVLTECLSFAHWLDFGVYVEAYADQLVAAGVWIIAVGQVGHHLDIKV